MTKSPARNPFKPGFNRPPTVFAGRDGVLRSAADLIDAVAAGDTGRPLVLIGTRGMGKTTALGEIAAAAAQERGWPAVRVEAKPGAGLVAELSARLGEAASALAQHTGKDRRQYLSAQAGLTVLGVGGSIGFTKAQEPASAPAVLLGKAFAEAAEAALRAGAGFVLAVDELQSAGREELAVFMSVLQEHVPAAWPVAVFFAGLPELQDKDRNVTYLERAEWHELGMLDETEAAQALVETARRGDREMTDRAARTLAEASGGYPFALQVFGYHAWRAAPPDAPRIDHAHAEAAVPAAHAELSAGMFNARWKDAAPLEQKYLVALAELRVQCPEARIDGGDVARRMGKATSSTAYLRDRLLKKGTLYSDRGDLRFVVPGLAEWIAERLRQ